MNTLLACLVGLLGVFAILIVALIITSRDRKRGRYIGFD